MVLEFRDGKSIELVKGDITKIPVDAIANAANSHLRGGGGVDGAIHAAGGPAIMRDLDQIRLTHGTCPTGGAVVTGAGNLPAKFVFHAVGPVFKSGKNGEPELLAAAYRSCLRLAESKGVRSLSFPSISTGVYGYPRQLAAPIALQTVADHLKEEGTKLQQVTFVLFDEDTLQQYVKSARSLETT